MRKKMIAAAFGLPLLAGTAFLVVSNSPLPLAMTAAATCTVHGAKFGVHSLG